MAVRLTEAMDARLTKCSERTKQSKHSLARDAIEAAVEAIERNDYKIVVPIEFEVTHIPTPLGKPEALAARGERAAADADKRSSGSIAAHHRNPHGTNEVGDLKADRLIAEPGAYGGGSSKPAGN